MGLNERIRRAREAIGLNRGEFAARLGVSPPTVTDWESGKIRSISALHMLKICSICGITADKLYPEIYGARKATEDMIQEAPSQYAADQDVGLSVITDTYHKMTDDQRQILQRVAEAILDPADVKKSTRKRSRIKRQKDTQKRETG